MFFVKVDKAPRRIPLLLCRIELNARLHQIWFLPGNIMKTGAKYLLAGSLCHSWGNKAMIFCSLTGLAHGDRSRRRPWQQEPTEDYASCPVPDGKPEFARAFISISVAQLFCSPRMKSKPKNPDSPRFRTILSPACAISG